MTGAGLIAAGLSVSALGSIPAACWPALSKGLGPFSLLVLATLPLCAGGWGLLALWRLSTVGATALEEAASEGDMGSRFRRFNPWGYIPLTALTIRHATFVLLALFPVIVLQVISVADIRCHITV